MSVNRFMSLLWALAMGAIVLYVFFTTLSHISPAEVAGLSIVIGVLAVFWFIRATRIDMELRDRAGDPVLRGERNRMRERRGF